MAFRIKADFLRALAHPTRLAVIEYLKKGDSSVGRMVGELGIEQSALSKHLGILRQAGILAARQEKANVYYSVKDRDIYEMLRSIAQILRKKLRESEKILSSLGRI
ncbi:MAG TPA: metalloregulator ArsR/SmtB family transcription factor [Elusimicrobiota bacterium]|nr:metalloregulator ArsR/SmtB family transcription factor [Elusimicrobiota bacterium]